MVKIEKNVKKYDEIFVNQYEYKANDEIKLNPKWYEEEFDTIIKYCHYYKSGWGQEYRYVKEELGSQFEIQSNSGRCSSLFHPYIILEDINGCFYGYNLMYSGNWKISIKTKQQLSQISIGYNDEFETNIKAGSNFKAPKVATTKSNKYEDLRIRWQKFSNEIMKSNELQSSLPVVWNHWWAYEDAKINEDVFLKNIKKAKKIGVEACVLDAGWFGNDQHWFDVRGDWSEVDKSKFPHGIEFLSQKVHELGMKFGFWVEIEGLGKDAKLQIEKPNFVATRDKKSLGYVCFGNKEVVDWAVDTLSKIIEKYNCEWIKFDFNLDPGLGCTCEEHGHGVLDGLDAHYRGLYKFFERLNEKYPNVVFENCSSGGQRTDLQLLSCMHTNFLSDPDYPIHKLRCIKNASECLAPNRIFHFMPSQTVGDEKSRPFANSDLSNLDESQRKYITRLGMLTSMGLSHRLIDYDDEVIAFLKKELNVYKEIVRTFIKASKYIVYDKGVATIHTYKKDDKCLVMVFSDQNIVLNLDEIGLECNVDYKVKDIDLNTVYNFRDKIKVEMKSEKVKTYIITMV